MNSRATRVDALNIALIVLACLAGHLFPFGLLTASYAILGPAHYLTQIAASLFLSILHVLLELPLNIRTFGELGAAVLAPHQLPSRGRRTASDV